MALTLNTLKPAKGAVKRSKRVGRGNASGHGTYSTRGLKGQRSRSGASGLKLIGLKKQIRQVPKKRGFRSLNPDNQVINFKDINKNFKDGDKVNPKSLAKARLIDKISLPAKLLNIGKLTVKDLEFSGILVSDTAKAQIGNMKGKVIVKS